jgi:carotenoid cleavage dioxygenase
MSAVGERVAWWMDGNFAPVGQETESFDLKIDGALPPELAGVYMRNGPDPKHGATPHWFLGDGMLHGLRIENGRAKWYRNRWVRTPNFLHGPAGVDRTGKIDRTRSSANTNIVRHAGRFLALEEGHFP